MKIPTIRPASLHIHPEAPQQRSAHQINQPVPIPAARNNLLITVFFILFFICLGVALSMGSETKSPWVEIVGQKVVNPQGETLGYVQDTAIDLERGRYFGVIVVTGGFFGGKTQIIPPQVMIENTNSKTLTLDMSKERFLNAPTLALSEERGPPNMAKAAELYRYYGQQPYFASQLTSAPDKTQKLVQLGYVMKGTRIIHLPVENLQGKFLGNVQTLMYLNSQTGRFRGVVIGDKIVPPDALRYNFDHTVLRINNHEQDFSDSTDFKFSPGGNYSTSGSPARPGKPLPPLQQGNSLRDKATTGHITDLITGNPNLSHYAKNIQVGTVQGIATIRGRVQSQKEKNQIEGYCRYVAGPKNYVNMLDVRPITAVDNAVDSDVK